jgi:hypothetical protein
MDFSIPENLIREVSRFKEFLDTRLKPRLTQISRWLSAHARTRTRTSCGPTSGSGTSP